MRSNKFVKKSMITAPTYPNKSKILTKRSEKFLKILV